MAQTRFLKKIADWCGTDLAVVLAFLLVPVVASAVVTYPPGALLQTGDVTTGIIRNATILDIDVATTTNISIFKIGQIAAGAIPFGRGDRFNATTTELSWDVTNTRLGIASSSPGATLSVNGSAIIRDTLTTANLVATGTTRLNGVTYTWPSADGTSGQSLTTNGAGALSFSSATQSDWAQLGEGYIATSAAVAVGVSGLSPRSRLLIQTQISTSTSAGSIQMRFNGDSGANYGIRFSENNAAQTTRNAQGQHSFFGGGNVGQFLTLTVDNGTSTAKFMRIAGGTLAAVPENAPTTYEGSGSWASTTTQITQIDLFITSGQMATGTRITVYGSRN